jgi:hypothetical protein
LILSCDYPSCTYAIDEEIIGDSPRSAEMRLNNHRKQKHGLNKNDASPEEATMADESTGADGTGPYGGIATDEVPPAPGGGDRSAGVDPPARGRGLLDRFRNRKGRDVSRETSFPGRKTEEKVPKSPRGYGKGGRQSAAKDIGDLWGWGGGKLQRIGHVPTGRMVRFQAPVAGELLDDVLKGSMLDKVVVQRLVAARGKLDMLLAVFGPVVLTWRLEQAIAGGASAAQIEGLQFLLTETVRNSVPVMVPAMKKVRKRTEAENAAMADMLDEGDLEALGIRVEGGKPVEIATGRPVDVAEVFVGMLFADWTAPVAPPAEHQPEETVNT